MVLDYCAVILAEQLSFTLRNMLIKNHGVLRITWLHFYVICPIIYLTYLNICQLYTRQMQFWRVIAGIFKANLYAILTGVLLMYVVQIAGTTSRLYTGALWILAFFFIVLFRFIVKTVVTKLSLLNEPVLLMGAGKTAEILLEHITKEAGISYRFIGYLEDNVPNVSVSANLPYLGHFEEAESVIRKTGVQNVLVAAPGLSQLQIQNIIYDLQPLVRNISFIPDMGTLPLSTMDIESLIDGHVVMFRMRNNLKNKFNRSIKFVFDWTATLLGGIIITPVLILIALWIKTDSPGPVIFKQKRIGQNGKEFYCYKFRTMCVDAKEQLEELLETNPEAKQEWEEKFKLKHDPRVTKSGDFLRRTSLDELPQIFNVLKGEMSLVGPRPIIEEEIHYYGKYIEDYYMVRPGITGMWQTSGRSDTGYEERVQMDAWYVRNWDFWFDIVLLWRTMKVVIEQKGAY
jgi:undecaprenyl-phosphate galactose phosphotransferase